MFKIIISVNLALLTAVSIVFALPSWATTEKRDNFGFFAAGSVGAFDRPSTLSITRPERQIASGVILQADRSSDIPKVSYGRYHALVIGVGDYAELPKLRTATADAQSVAATLDELYGFNVRLLTNPSRDDILDALDDYHRTLKRQDNLLVYYAGRGWLNEQSDMCIWFPKNARLKRRSEWVSSMDVSDALRDISAKHIMLVVDSCYSETSPRTTMVTKHDAVYVEQIATKRARVVIVSGGLEPVANPSDTKHSVFAAQFVEALNDNKGLIDGTTLFGILRRQVMLHTDQEPEYLNIKSVGHEGGDFLFVRRNQAKGR